MKFILTILFFPLKLISYIYLNLKVFLSKGNYTIITIPSDFKTSEKSFLAKFISKEEKKDLLFIEFLEILHTASKNSHLKQVLFVLESPSYGFSEVDSICFYIKKMNENGIETYGYTLTGDMRSLYLLSHMKYRLCLESSEFHSFFFNREVFFWKGLIDKIGVNVETFQSGPYKSFAEPFTRENFSEKAKQNLEEVFISLNSNLEIITKNSNLSKENLQKPTLRAKFLKEEKFITDFSNQNDFLDLYKENKKYKKTKSAYSKLLIKKEDFSFKSKKKSKIAILPLKGSINMGKVTDTQFTNGKITYYSLKKIFDEIGKDECIKGIILEIDSPGGSAFASELIYQEIMLLRKTKRVYAYFQNVAASGGYYIACACEKIYASNFTITGSIGTIMIRPNLRELYHKIGISKDSIFNYPMRDIFSEYETLSEQSKNYLNEEIKLEELKFYNRVINARNKTLEDMDELGGGRVFSSKDFLKKQMIDKISTLNETLYDLKNELKIEKLETDYYMAKNSLRDRLEGLNAKSNFEFLEELKTISQLEFGAHYIDMRFY